MDIVLSKNGVKSAAFKISGVQRLFTYQICKGKSFEIKQKFIPLDISYNIYNPIKKLYENSLLC